MPEFVRAAIVAHCERSEKLHGQRTRAAKAAAATCAREGDAVDVLLVLMLIGDMVQSRPANSRAL